MANSSPRARSLDWSMSVDSGSVQEGPVSWVDVLVDV